ncbi:Calcium-transporting ATPase 10, plasma membrane-type [Boothiomyces macroporosus]|uniref:Calcium-transporting ATPase n=1 Tax=Boothiomyces macroporosus TaxID=261099 RepID=A0AAD5Y667_9FUNG|nr:Calcium-transporting ATPase 10, plasma membrane-type [Boothiomyces macroporosus]
MTSHSLSTEELTKLVDPKNPTLLKELGGIEGVAQKLGTDLTTGLTLIDKARTDFYGTNALPEVIPTTFLEFIWQALQDKTLVILMIAAAVELGVGVYKSFFAADKEKLALLDGATILVAVTIVVLIGAVSDYRKQAQFRQLNDFGKSFNTNKVIRNNNTEQVNAADLVVGDIVIIETGVVVPADGLLVSGYNIEADESTMTGEPHAVKKDQVKDPFLLSGTSINNGVGKMVIIATGINSLNGKTMLALDVEPEDTPLQQKLGKLADNIAKYAIYGSIAIILLLFVLYLILHAGNYQSFELAEAMLNIIILAVAIIVVAVPEGLPLAVTLSLAHATLQMLKDNNLVRHLASCETMGNATTICSDKTGTLTLNKMTVVEGIVLESKFEQSTIEQLKLASPLIKFVAKSLNVNSSAAMTVKNGKAVMEGSKTEVALLDFTKLLGFDYVEDRKETKVISLMPFSSARKRMSCLVEVTEEEVPRTLGLSKEDAEECIFVKGASEIVLEHCYKYVNKDGKIMVLSNEEKAKYNQYIKEFAGKALRTICAAIKPVRKGEGMMDDVIDDDSELVLVGIFGILDPLRPEVPNAVAQCQAAGVCVRMVTGDGIETAKAIARGCGILSADGIVMEGPEFRNLSQEQMDQILPKLQVLARSSPLDKQILVNNLKRLGETVAVTGDGTNDAPALTSADVGFSMGIAGTEVAKEASDIILIDDNFASIVKAVIWGRCVYDAIKKFLQFQLTVNISASVITIITSIYTTIADDRKPESVLNAVQLLWVNLVMDTLAALALATDPPSDELLNRKPAKKDESLITHSMMKQMIGQALYQVFICLFLYFLGPTWFPGGTINNETPEQGYPTATIVFNAFIFCNMFNEINSRSISKEPEGLSAANWGISILAGFGSLPVGFLIRLLPDFEKPELEELEVKSPSQSVDSTATLPNIVELDERVADQNVTAPLPVHRTLSAERWKRAIRSTRLQVRVVRGFKQADGKVIRAAETMSQKSSRSSRSAFEANISPAERWSRLREHVITNYSSNQRRHPPTLANFADPRRVRREKIYRAVSNIVGAGIFVLTGKAAKENAGPGIVFSFIIAGVVSSLSSLCYAELASTLPVSGSAYSYTYASLGEIIAWIIGWDLMLEYLVGAATANYDPLVPPNTGTRGEYGASGVLEAAVSVFFAYIGFDAVTTASQEAVNPQRDLPIGIIGSLSVCTLLYISVCMVLTGMQNYKAIDVNAPVAGAVRQYGYPVLTIFTEVGAVAGLTSVLLTSLLGQPRIFQAMSLDGLFPPVFARIHPTRKTPYAATLTSSLICATLASLLPVDLLGNLTSVGTLFAFFLVSISVMVLRITSPDLKRHFVIPGGKFVGGFVIPGLSATFTLFLISQAAVSSLLRIIIWLAVGLVIYFGYGYHHSVIGNKIAKEEDHGGSFELLHRERSSAVSQSTETSNLYEENETA